MELPNSSKISSPIELEKSKGASELLRFYSFTGKEITESIETYIPAYAQLIESFRIEITGSEIKQILQENEVLKGEKVHKSLLLSVLTQDHELDRLIQAFCNTYSYDLVTINLMQILAQPANLFENISKQINEWLKLQRTRLINSPQSDKSPQISNSNKSLEKDQLQASKLIDQSLSQENKSKDLVISKDKLINSKETSFPSSIASNLQNSQFSIHPFIVLADFSSISMILQNEHIINRKEEKCSLQQIRRDIISAFRLLEVGDAYNLLIMIETADKITEPGLDQEVDAILPVPLPDLDSRREFFLHTILPAWIPLIDCNHFAMETEGWSFGMIREFLQYARWLFILAQKQSIGEKVQFDTKFLLDVLQKYQKSQLYLVKMNSEKIIHSLIQGNLIEAPSNKRDFSLVSEKESIGIEALTSDFETQIYQSAATSNYDDLVIALDKMSKGLTLTDFERQSLADNAFLLKDPPSKALQKLHKAKLRMDKILSLNPKHNRKMKSHYSDQNFSSSTGGNLDSTKSENKLPE